MNPIRAAAVSIAFGALSASSVGQETPPPAPAPAPETSAPAPANPRPQVNDEVFIPSEELAADEEVTFPVDI
jgi:hypothetical protein